MYHLFLVHKLPQIKPANDIALNERNICSIWVFSHFGIRPEFTKHIHLNHSEAMQHCWLAGAA